MADSGRVFYTNLELTSKFTNLQTLVRSLLDTKLSVRSKTVINRASTDISVPALVGSIIIIPHDLLGEARYRLPGPREIIQFTKKRSFEVFIRNDSGYDVSLLSSEFVVIDGPNTISGMSGSQWYVNLSSEEASYTITRLI
jgi:hypothetical protein